LIGVENSNSNIPVFRLTTVQDLPYVYGGVELELHSSCPNDLSLGIILDVSQQALKVLLLLGNHSVGS
jgi:hypothetical protein